MSLKKIIGLVVAANAVGLYLGEIMDRARIEQLDKELEIEQQKIADIKAVIRAEKRTQDRIRRGDFDGRPLEDVMTEIKFQQIAAHYE